MKQHFYLCILLLCSGISQAQDGWEVLTSKYSNVTLRDVYANGNTIIAVGSNISTFTPFIISSTNGGETWDTTKVGSGPLFRSIAFATPDIGMITSVNTSSCALRTEDGGKTWNWHYCDLDSSFTGVNQVFFLDNKIGYMAGWGKTAFQDGVIYKTMNGGSTWEHVSGNLPNKPFEYLQFIDEENGYGGSSLFGHSNLYRTSDGGKTWADLPVKELEFSHVHFQNINDGMMVCGNGNIQRTTDGGETWKVITTQDDIYFMGIGFLNTETIYAVGTNGSFQSKIFLSDDGGETWTEEGAGIAQTPIEKVRFFDGRAYAIGGKGVILRSRILDGTGIEENRLTPSSIKVYPNPAHAFTTIQLEETTSFPVHLTLHDVYGKKVMDLTQSPSSGKIGFSTADIAAGVYLINLADQSNTMYHATLVIE